MKVISSQKINHQINFSVLNFEPKKLLKDHVRIQVKSASLTSGDKALIKMKSKKKTSYIPGQFFTGIITEVGYAVKDFTVGSRVVGFLKDGALQEEVLVKTDQIALLPDNMSYDQGVSLIFGGTTALHFLSENFHVMPDKRICIYGASGEVGYLSLQLMIAYGFDVTAFASQKHHEDLLSLGVRECIDYKEHSILESYKLYDVIFDTVGKIDVESLLPKLDQEQVFISTQLSTTLLKKKVTNKFRKRGSVMMWIANISNHMLKTLLQLWELDQIKGKIDSVYDEKDIATAYGQLTSGKKNGSIIIHFNKED